MAAPTAPQHHALAFLGAEHLHVQRTFEHLLALHRLGPDAIDEQALAASTDDLCEDLRLHSQLEEEIFFPALRAAGVAPGPLESILEEHSGARELIARLEQLFPGDEHFGATLGVLQTEVARIIAFEESVLFPAARQAGIDLRELGARLARRHRAIDAPDDTGGMRRAVRPPN